VEPFVKKYDGEWSVFLNALDAFVMGLVIEPHAMAFVWRDLHGLVLGGFADLPRIKSALRLTKFIVALYRKNNIVLHTHHAPGTLGRKMAEHIGCIQDAGAQWLEVG